MRFGFVLALQVQVDVSCVRLFRGAADFSSNKLPAASAQSAPERTVALAVRSREYVGRGRLGSSYVVCRSPPRIQSATFCRRRVLSVCAAEFRLLTRVCAFDCRHLMCEFCVRVVVPHVPRVFWCKPSAPE